MRDGVLKRRRLARDPAVAEGFGLDGHVVRDLDRSTPVHGAVLGGLAAVGGVADRRVIGVAAELDRLGAGIGARPDRGPGRCHGLRRGDLDLHGHGFGQAVVVDVARVHDRARRGELLGPGVRLVEARNRVPLDGERDRAAARLARGRNLLGERPGRALACVLPGLVAPGLLVGKAHVREGLELGVLDGARGREGDADRLGAVVGLRDIGRAVLDPDALAVDGGLLVEHVLRGRGPAALDERERGGVGRHVRGAALVVALGRPGDLGVAAAVGEQRRDVGPLAGTTGLDLHGACRLSEDRVRRRHVDVNVDLAYHRVVDGGDRHAVVHAVERQRGAGAALVADEPLLEHVAVALGRDHRERLALLHLVVLDLCGGRLHARVGLVHRHRLHLRVVHEVEHARRLGGEAVLLRPDHEVVDAHGVLRMVEVDGTGVLRLIALDPGAAVVIVNAVFDGRARGRTARGDLKFAVDELVGVLRRGVRPRRRVGRRGRGRHGLRIGHRHQHVDVRHVLRQVNPRDTLEGDLPCIGAAARGLDDLVVLDDTVEVVPARVDTQRDGRTGVGPGADARGQRHDEVAHARALLHRHGDGLDLGYRGRRGAVRRGGQEDRAVPAGLGRGGGTAVVTRLDGDRRVIGKDEPVLLIAVDPGVGHVGDTVLGLTARRRLHRV